MTFESTPFLVNNARFYFPLQFGETDIPSKKYLSLIPLLDTTFRKHHLTHCRSASLSVAHVFSLLIMT
ncbi:Protein of unknown function [Pyronema omphalodes CBS 100304]|uniref:Uncharacterized protein n=1 Tax=Pyronema omphalodes (strain CBS 100304) TaxID=1076935 RepID=U4KTU5_PYROM|nr:Protein of unknown function [Pyronema omphalodes CBS 100304]